MKVKVHIINTWCVIKSEAVTVPSFVMTVDFARTRLRGTVKNDFQVVIACSCTCDVNCRRAFTFHWVYIYIYTCVCFGEVRTHENLDTETFEQGNP